MKFFTSYYANLNKIKELPGEYITVSISGDIPQDIKDSVDIWDRRFSPTWDLFKEYKNSPEGQQREDRYVQRFKDEVLLNRDINSIVKSWSDNFGLNQKYVLLCYETPSDFCHRHIVAEAISDKYGIEVPELFLDYDNYEIQKYKAKLKGTLDDSEW
jgi:uncharacterized protein YeaO (DUF488 family)